MEGFDVRFATICVYSRTADGWLRRIFTNVHVRILHALKTEDGGRCTATSLCARIFSESARSILPGDKVCLGIGGDAPGEGALTVCEISDNFVLRRGGHIRITAK